MKIEYIQEMTGVKNTDWVKKLKYQKYSSFNFETKYWADELLFSRERQENQMLYQPNFVGIIWAGDTLILSIPKAVHLEKLKKADENERRETLLMYAKLFDRYFMEVRECSKSVRNSDGNPYEIPNPWGIECVKEWCENALCSSMVLPVPQIIAAVKFEKVYEWMLGWLYQNQIHLDAGNCVRYDSVFIGKKNIDINNELYNSYKWIPKGKRKNGKLEKRNAVFEAQKKRNIPDIVYEFSQEEYSEDQYCCIIDAKYSGWNRMDNCYKLPDNSDIYKQFFYQEQLKRLYEEEDKQGIYIYNFLALPDYMEDTEEKLLRLCSRIEFEYHPSNIAVLQVNVSKLIKACSENDETIFEEQKKSMGPILHNNNEIHPMVSEKQEENKK